jgi:hypothetical protein
MKLSLVKADSARRKKRERRNESKRESRGRFFRPSLQALEDRRMLAFGLPSYISISSAFPHMARTLPGLFAPQGQSA